MSIHVETVGSGRDLVLLHGWGMHGGVWDPVKSLLARNFRLHLIDMPGFGYSADAMSKPYTMQHLVEQMTQSVPEKILLCGWSMSGQIAMQWALQQPEQLERLVLVSTTPKFVNSSDWGHGIQQEVFDRFADSIQRDYQPAMTRFLTLQAQGGDNARETMRELKQHFFQRPAPSLQALEAGLALLQNNDLRHDVADIKVPTLIMHGARDRVVPAAASSWLAAQMNTGLEVQKNASHAPFLSHPEWFADTLIKYLQ
ncbi:MAG TPA: pimeloyl-ACP methyl ester esterase BioH [Methylophilaceae bacterium]|jgi:pimeloyl-[acyl-carrier protein] methyl ester esterase